MKLLLWVILIVVLIFAPVVPHEREIQHGTTVIEAKSIVVYLYDRYQQVQEAKHVNRTDGGETSQ